MTDSMDIERMNNHQEPAVTIPYTANDGNKYLLDFVDTPGHVDFMRGLPAIASCEGALLLVDASQGIESQTLSNMYLPLNITLKYSP